MEYINTENFIRMGRVALCMRHRSQTLSVALQNFVVSGEGAHFLNIHTLFWLKSKQNEPAHIASFVLLSLW